MNRNGQTWLGGFGLVLAVVLVWSGNQNWRTDLDDTLPLLAGLPMAAHLGRPWVRLSGPPGGVWRWWLLAGLLMFVPGRLLASMTWQAWGWTLMALAWVLACFEPRPGRLRIGWILCLSFPWLVLEWPSLGWYFRVSSAAVVGGLYELLGLPVSREGTDLMVAGLPIEIEAACAGWNLLQLTLLAGVGFGISGIRSPRRFAMLLGLLPVIAWLANLIRILLLSVLALTFDVHLAAGALHGTTGLVVLFGVVALTKGICGLLEPRRRATIRTIQPT